MSVYRVYAAFSWIPEGAIESSGTRVSDGCDFLGVWVQGAEFVTSAGTTVLLAADLSPLSLIIFLFFNLFFYSNLNTTFLAFLSSLPTLLYTLITLL